MTWPSPDAVTEVVENQHGCRQLRSHTGTLYVVVVRLKKETGLRHRSEAFFIKQFTPSL